MDITQTNIFENINKFFPKRKIYITKLDENKISFGDGNTIFYISATNYKHTIRNFSNGDQLVFEDDTKLFLEES